MIICIFRGHRWSQWYQAAKYNPYRYCIRCDATEEKIGLVVVRKRNVLSWLVSLTKPSFEVSLEQSYRKTTRQKEVRLGLLFALIIFIFPISLFLFGATKYEVVILILAIVIFVLMWLQHRDNVKEDKARGICKGRNRVGSLHLSGLLLCGVGIYIIASRWDSLSVTVPLHWVWVLFGLFFLYRGWICFRAGSEYDKTIDRLEEYEAQLKRLRFELDEWGRLKRLTPTEDKGD